MGPMKTTFVAFEREALKSGFRFTGFTAEGEKIVVRAKATRPYTFAAIHSHSVNTKFWTYDAEGKSNGQTDPRGFVTFHGTPNPSRSHRNDAIVAVLPITDAHQERA